MEANSSLLVVAFISLVAAISPGPDFFIVLKNSITYSRRAGLMTALGMGTALIIHLSYSLLGIGLVLAESPLLYTIIKYAGIAYLFYLGVSSLMDSFKKGSSKDVNYARSKHGIPLSQAFTQGFLTNLLNPKAAVFFISLFSQFIGPTTPLLVKVEYGLVNWAVTISWFLFLAFIVSGEKLLGKIDKYRIYVDRIMGCVLILLGLILLLGDLGY